MMTHDSYRVAAILRDHPRFAELPPLPTEGDLPDLETTEAADVLLAYLRDRGVSVHVRPPTPGHSLHTLRSPGLDMYCRHLANGAAYAVLAWWRGDAWWRVGAMTCETKTDTLEAL